MICRCDEAVKILIWVIDFLFVRYVYEQIYTYSKMIVEYYNAW